MLQTILDQFLAPAARRLGSTVAGMVLAIGFTTEVATASATVVTAFVLYGVDLVFSAASRKNFKSRVLHGQA